MERVKADPDQADHVYERIMGQAVTARKRRNIELLRHALIAIQSSPAPNYSLSFVGKALEALGGPKTQSLRNAGGKDFRDLIAAFSRGASPPAPAHVHSTSSTAIDVEIRRIPNLAVQASLKMIIEENRRLKRENDTLRAEFRSLSLDLTRHIQPQPQPQGDANCERASLKPPSSSLSNLATGTLRQFLSNDWIASRGLALQPDGSIVHSWLNDALIAPPGFVNALREITLADDL